jgi:hypothetical protein
MLTGRSITAQGVSGVEDAHRGDCLQCHNSEASNGYTFVLRYSVTLDLHLSRLSHEHGALNAYTRTRLPYSKCQLLRAGEPTSVPERRNMPF